MDELDKSTLEKATKISENLSISKDRLLEDFEGEGTTYESLVDHIQDNEIIKHIFTAKSRGLAIGQKDDYDEGFVHEGDDIQDMTAAIHPTYVFTNKRVLCILPNTEEEKDEIYEVFYENIHNIEIHIGWTRQRIEIITEDNGETYHLWISGEEEDDLENAKKLALASDENENKDVIDEKTQTKEQNQNSGTKYSFTAKKKGIKIKEEDEVKHFTSKKGSKSKFEFTDNQFIATVPQESDDEVFVVDYNSIDDVEFSSGFRKNRIDIQAKNKLYKFWTKDSVDSSELMEFIAEGAGAESLTVYELLTEDEKVQKEYTSETWGIKITNEDNGEEIRLSPPDRNEAQFVFTDDRFLAVVPQDMDDKSFSTDYDSIVDIEYTSGTTVNRIDLYAPPETYTFKFDDDIPEKSLIEFVYNKIKDNKSNELAEEIGENESIRMFTTSKKHGIEIRGNRTKPKNIEAKFVFTDNRFLAYIPREKSNKLSTADYDSIVDFESSSGITKNRVDIFKHRTTWKFWTTDDPSRIISFLSRNAGRERFELVESDDEKGTLRIEGWTEGPSDINADVDASSRSKGKSSGIQAGPFFASKTASKSSIKGDISGKISDNTYTAEIERLEIYKQNLTLESGVELDIHLSEIESVFKQQGGLVIEVAGTTFRMGDLPSDAKVSEAVSYIKDQMASSDEETEIPSSDEEDKKEGSDSTDVDTAEKIRELKDLHEDGILTEEEFETKKEELLDDF